LFAPKKTPAPIIKTLNSNVQQALKGLDPKIVFNAGVEIVGSSPEEFARFIAVDRARMGEVIKSGAFNN
jgi:tripartite-type tricarboxylate transporter receptor subunit TctC